MTLLVPVGILAPKTCQTVSFSNTVHPIKTPLMNDPNSEIILTSMARCGPLRIESLNLLANTSTSSPLVHLVIQNDCTNLKFLFLHTPRIRTIVVQPRISHALRSLLTTVPRLPKGPLFHHHATTILLSHPCMGQTVWQLLQKLSDSKIITEESFLKLAKERAVNVAFLDATKMDVQWKNGDQALLVRPILFASRNMPRCSFSTGPGTVCDRSVCCS